MKPFMPLRLAGYVLACVALFGCQQKMADQPRYEPLEASRFFADGRSARRPVAGTIPRDWEQREPSYYTGRMASADARDELSEPPSLDEADQYLTRVPFPLNAESMRRGQERFGIHCAPCHGPAGTGDGLVVRHGYPQARSYHTDRLRRAPIGYVFDVATRGIGQMPAYGRRINADDRWLIAAYVRALQLSEHAELSELPPELRERFADGGAP